MARITRIVDAGFYSSVGSVKSVVNVILVLDWRNDQNAPSCRGDKPPLVREAPLNVAPMGLVARMLDATRGFATWLLPATALPFRRYARSLAARRASVSAHRWRSPKAAAGLCDRAGPEEPDGGRFARNRSQCGTKLNGLRSNPIGSLQTYRHTVNHFSIASTLLCVVVSLW